MALQLGNHLQPPERLDVSTAAALRPFTNLATKETSQHIISIDSGIFERVMIGNRKLSQALREIHPDIFNSFKDSYVFEFLNLPDPHKENDLQKGLIMQMKKFILELGKDFLFIGEEYKVQVGNRDFYIDLLFFHRGLQCLVAFELKKEKFEPEHLGKVNFYLEALDRDVKKENENPINLKLLSSCRH